MSLLCTLGRHRPSDLPRWNDGFYFTTCRRCGSDLVRTAYESWHVPEGYRVVWSAEPPEPRTDAELVKEDSATPTARPDAVAPPPQSGARIDDAPPPQQPITPNPGGEEEEAGQPHEPDETASHSDEPATTLAEASDAVAPPVGLPIEEVLAHASRHAIGPSLDPVETRPARPLRHWDFMEEETPDVPSPPPGGPQQTPHRGGPAAAGILPDPPPPPADPVASRAAQALAGVGRAARTTWADANPVVIVTSAVFLACAIIGLLYLLAPQRTTRGIAQSAPPSSAAPPAAINPGHPAPQETVAAAGVHPQAYVAATLLACRAGPSAQARKVRNLSRGTEVAVLQRDGNWLSIGRGGRQCWVEARYVSDLLPY